MKKILILLCVLFVLPAVPVFSYSGETGYNFLKIDSGNRAVAMGGAYAGVSQDIIAVFYNPAGLYNIKNKEVYLMYRQWLLDTTYGTISYAQNFPDIAVFSAGIIYLKMPELDRINTLGYSDGEKISGNSFAFMVTGARKTYYDIILGSNLKYLQESIITTQNSSIVIDIGLQKKIFSTPSDSLSAGTVLQNWNFAFGLNSENPVPLNWKTGLEYTAYKDFKINFDINKQIARDFLYNIGGEYKILQMLFLRAGYKIGYDLESFSLGFGINSNTFYKSVIIYADYSLTSFGLLSRSQNLSLKIQF